MPKPLDQLLLDGAAESGALTRQRLPIFPREIKACTTADSSPYLCAFDDLYRLYGGNTHRKHLLNDLSTFVTQSQDMGVQISALLIGGSFLDQARTDPKDIDCLAYYYIPGTGDFEAIIEQWDRYTRTSPVDVKLCPIDVGAIAIIKRSIYFSNLFSINKSTLQLEMGTILVTLE